MMSILTVSVVIATRDRKSDLRRAIASCLRQTAAPEILVLDDGSTDGTADMVRQEFRRLRRRPGLPLGIGQRHLAAGDD